MTYGHTQRGWLHIVAYVLALVMLAGAWLARAEPAVAGLNVGIAVILAISGLMFGSLRVRDEGEWLALRYGLLPVFRKRICYADVTAVEPDRTRLIDGWGIHWVPGRGWTYNLWGFGCVKLTLGKKIIRIGTDDVEGLTEFLVGKAAVERLSAMP